MTPGDVFLQRQSILFIACSTHAPGWVLTQEGPHLRININAVRVMNTQCADGGDVKGSGSFVRTHWSLRIECLIRVKLNDWGWCMGVCTIQRGADVLDYFDGCLRSLQSMPCKMKIITNDMRRLTIKLYIKVA